MPDHFIDHIANHHRDHWANVERTKNDSVTILITHFDQQPMQRASSKRGRAAWMGIGELQKVEIPGTDDSLRAALHP